MASAFLIKYKGKVMVLWTVQGTNYISGEKWGETINLDRVSVRDSLQKDIMLKLRPKGKVIAI